MSIGSKFSPRKDQPGGCPTCGGPDGTVRFDWKIALEDPESEFAHYSRSLAEQKPLRSGSLYKCSTCGQKWWLSPDRETMTLVPRDKLILLEQWNSQPLTLSPTLLAQARAIGATPAHHLAGQADYAEVPCRVRTLRGETLDKCLITFRNYPPLDALSQPPRFITEIAEILPSALALPLEVRLETSRSKPDRSGRASTWVLGPKDRPLVLDWVVNFLDQKGLQGSDLHLAPRGIKRSLGRGKPLQEPEDLTLFLTDWAPSLL